LALGGLRGTSPRVRGRLPLREAQRRLQGRRAVPQLPLVLLAPGRREGPRRRLGGGRLWWRRGLADLRRHAGPSRPLWRAVQVCAQKEWLPRWRIMPRLPHMFVEPREGCRSRHGAMGRRGGAAHDASAATTPAAAAARAGFGVGAGAAAASWLLRCFRHAAARPHWGTSPTAAAAGGLEGTRRSFRTAAAASAAASPAAAAAAAGAAA